MIRALQMAGSCALAAFFCYLITNTFHTLRNRACRIASLGTPVVLGSLLLAFPDAILNPLYESLLGFPAAQYGPGESLVIIIASALVVITLLIANLVAQVRLLKKDSSGHISAKM